LSFEGIPLKVAIIGVGQSSYGEKKDQSIDEIVFEATKKALDDSGLRREEIESVVTAGSDELDGRAISNMITAGSAGAYLKDEVKVSDGGIYGLVLGYLRVASDVFSNSLIVSWTKSSEVSSELISNLASEPLYLRDCGLNSITSLALQASAYIDRADVRDEDAVKVVLKNRENGLKNPLSHLSYKPPKKEVNSSRFVSYPLREIFIPPKSDGACALVIASKEKARSLNKKCAWILGLGWAIDEYYAGDRDLSKLSSLRKSSDMAYKMAGIKRPFEEISVAEVSDVTPYHEMMVYEALGFCRDREGKELIKYGITKPSGKLPVNPSGGILSSNPIFASSLVRVAEAALQVMGKAEKRQVKNAGVALAQGFTGMFSQGSCVVVLGS
jgi:acetyl-CoA C-acetyltransferase